jgi:hypothetical protein
MPRLVSFHPRRGKALEPRSGDLNGGDLPRVELPRLRTLTPKEDPRFLPVDSPLFGLRLRPSSKLNMGCLPPHRSPPWPAATDLATPPDWSAGTWTESPPMRRSTSPRSAPSTSPTTKALEASPAEPLVKTMALKRRQPGQHPRNRIQNSTQQLRPAPQKTIQAVALRIVSRNQRKIDRCQGPIDNTPRATRRPPSCTRRDVPNDSKRNFSATTRFLRPPPLLSRLTTPQNLPSQRQPFFAIRNFTIEIRRPNPS